MQLEFLFRPGRLNPGKGLFVIAGGRQVPLCLVRNRRARRYVLRLRPDGTARITVPRAGTIEEARRFAERSVPWLERQLARQASEPRQPTEWHIGMAVLFRGEMVQLARDTQDKSDTFHHVILGPERIRPGRGTTDLRPAVERHLRALAVRELSARVFELAARHQYQVNRVTVRNQRSRWGSCSRRGTISLNWRLIQTPDFVRDYIIWHELAHLKEMNHSKRFWREVERLCPGYEAAERWLKEHRELMRE